VKRGKNDKVSRYAAKESCCSPYSEMDITRVF
jgi:hypothetical protein